MEKQGRAGKRGLVGILFVIKIVGALAEQGKSLEEVYNHAEIIAKNIATYGVALRPCSLPGLLLIKITIINININIIYFN